VYWNALIEIPAMGHQHHRSTNNHQPDTEISYILPDSRQTSVPSARQGEGGLRPSLTKAVG
jgi:hypothetical protein